MNNGNLNSIEPTCYVIGSMSMGNEVFKPKKDDFVIAADGGYTNLQKLGIKPNLLIGDFDSLDVIPKGEKIIQLPKEKNDTDTIYAVKLGIDKGYKKIVIYGGIGGRLDHTIANIQTLAYIAKQGARGFLIADGIIITAIKNSKIEFPTNSKGIISVFCNGSSAEGVYLTGLKYSLVNATLTSDTPLGVSNEFTDSESSVSVKSGMLIIMWNK